MVISWRYECVPLTALRCHDRKRRHHVVHTLINRGRRHSANTIRLKQIRDQLTLPITGYNGDKAAKVIGCSSELHGLVFPWYGNYFFLKVYVATFRIDCVSSNQLDLLSVLLSHAYERLIPFPRHTGKVRLLVECQRVFCYRIWVLWVRQVEFRSWSDWIFECSSLSLCAVLNVGWLLAHVVLSGSNHARNCIWKHLSDFDMKPIQRDRYTSSARKYLPAIMLSQVCSGATQTPSWDRRVTRRLTLWDY